MHFHNWILISYMWAKCLFLTRKKILMNLHCSEQHSLFVYFLMLALFSIELQNLKIQFPHFNHIFYYFLFSEFPLLDFIFSDVILSIFIVCHSIINEYILLPLFSLKFSFNFTMTLNIKMVPEWKTFMTRKHSHFLSILFL